MVIAIATYVETPQIHLEREAAQKTMNRDPAAWARLGQALRQARLARGLSQEDLARAADVSVASLQNVESGKVPKGRMPYTIAPVARELGWPFDAVDAVLEGGPPPDGWQSVPVQGQVDAEQVSAAITTALVRATDHVTAAEIRAATQIALDELRRNGLLLTAGEHDLSASDS